MTHTAVAYMPALAGDPAFSPESRIWVYTANRPLTETEAQHTQQALDVFTRQWTAHNQALKARAEVFQNQILLLMVDETNAGASGCSIDKSVHFLENLGKDLQVDFFDRMRFAWVEDGQVRFTDRNGLEAAAGSGRINDETGMLNTLVQTKKDLLEKWLVPFAKSWHKRLV
ncbi:MAG: ABC transporter ATPase [Lewinellaceae bacterium]|nr:ABC transporter ATPase [Lewinellaceae bacterium]